MEVLLAYIEFSQFEQYLLDKHGDEIDQETANKIELVEFPSNIPLSEIIEDREIINGDNKANTANKSEVFVCKMKAYALFQKFLKPG